MAAGFQNTDQYADIIDLPHYVSKKHPRMSLYDRAAQFSPFAALTGHGEAIRETARWTDDMAELDENRRDQLDEKLLYLQSILDRRPDVTITYFLPDERKRGGSYQTAEGQIRKIDLYDRVIVMQDFQRIPIDHVAAIESDAFRHLE